MLTVPTNSIFSEWTGISPTDFLKLPSPFNQLPEKMQLEATMRYPRAIGVKRALPRCAFSVRYRSPFFVMSGIPPAQTSTRFLPSITCRLVC
jgi:hypothetical protein